jgi:glycosyltransferase involved in cell wall biosynthesis
MRILYVCADHGIPILGRKGASVHVRAMASAFTRDGHRVIVAAPVLARSPWETPESIEADVLHVPVDESVTAAVEAVKTYGEVLGDDSGVSSEVRRMLYSRQLEAKLTRKFRNELPDFIYERASLFGTAGLATARQLGVPLVVELNAPLGLEQATYRSSTLTRLSSQAERYVLSGADLVLTVSNELRDYAIGAGAAPERTEVMPNGIDPTVFALRPIARREPVAGPTIGFVGGLRPWHGVRALPPLLERLAQRFPTVRLVIAGDGPLRGELEAAFDARGLSSRVVFTGMVGHGDVAEIVRTFDVALAPYEPIDHVFYFSPLKLFEYMGCGVPVVAADLGQLSAIVKHGHNGLLYAPGDLDALARACEDVIGDADLASRLGSEGAKTVHQHHTWSANARRVIDLVKTLSLGEACA